MRIWTFHPKYLDTKGLVALWRESLLAQKVLRGLTKGYTYHPQLERFKAQNDPVGAIGKYMQTVHEESTRREYKFDPSRIVPTSWAGIIQETEGQLFYEWGHFLRKVEARNPDHFESVKKIKTPAPHPLFERIDGGVQGWERT